MEKKEALKITAAILTHSVVSHLPPGTLTSVRLPDPVAAEVRKIFETMYEALSGMDSGS